ncbi:hypothetical protein KDA_26810 [Dictyobacter alpinus]|uniref:Uncharacterized protein n=1 Tax=Dictyobacter alpinus TaxID=2014873 RepID=A0A402B795_9CHLR|nr:hypothetical protein KDA_26810 [Dictyobacter alpinus]
MLNNAMRKFPHLHTHSFQIFYISIKPTLVFEEENGTAVVTAVPFSSSKTSERRRREV